MKLSAVAGFRLCLVLCGLIAIIGVGLILWGKSIPVFTDFDAASSAFAGWCSADGSQDVTVESAYFGYFTRHYTLINIGMNLALGALSAAAIFASLFGT